MSLFKKAENRQAFLKAGLMGLAGSGKTFTATEIAIGLIEHMRARGLHELAAKPVAFMDTETGSDWSLPKFQAAGIDMMVNRSRSLWDLRNAIAEAERECSILIIDSITHFWRVFCEEYAERKNRKRGLEFSDWAFLKKEWAVFTDLYVNSQLHIIMCGRQGYEYDFMEKDDGKKELIKTGVKMKAEGETGFEPSILIAMEQEHRMVNGELKEVYRVAKVLKDRSTHLDGKSIRNPTFKDFLPHIECLNLGTKQQAIDTGDNAALFSDDGSETRWQRERDEKAAVLEEITEVIKKHYTGQSESAKAERGALMEKHFGTRAWTRVEALPLAQLKNGRNTLWLQLEGREYAFVPPTIEPKPVDVPTVESAA